MLRFLLSVSLVLWHIGLNGQQKPLVKSSYIQRILNEKGSIKYVNYSSSIVLLDSLVLKKDQSQQIIKSEKASIITSSGTGLVYKQTPYADSTFHFSRLDATLYDGYNFDDIKFIYHDTLFSVGGFGFWRNNGQVRYFAENNEWELLFPEIPMGISNRHIWNLDSKKGLLYVHAYVSLAECSAYWKGLAFQLHNPSNMEILVAFLAVFWYFCNFSFEN
jgi:hypothetical protein